MSERRELVRAQAGFGYRSCLNDLPKLPVSTPKSPDWKMPMELWTEYEGRTIDGAFPLNRLLLPEGRSAFFSTSNGNGEPTVIRLIESHFDEQEILARWQGVDALRHPNLLKLDTFGQLDLDGTTVIYAVMEPVDANLAEVLKQQRLTLPECRALAKSLASALDTLHANGFVHEHLEPSSVFAVGDVVKLRSDCIRETPEGEQGLAAKRRDLRSLAVVLLQALTQEPTLEAAAGKLPLPAPFDAIVRNATTGAWGFAEIMSALNQQKRAAAPLAAVPAPISRADPQPAASVGRPIAPSLRSASEPKPPDSTLSQHPAFPILSPDRPLGDQEGRHPEAVPLSRFIAAAALFAILILGLGLYFVHARATLRTANPQVHSVPKAASSAIASEPSQVPANSLPDQAARTSQQADSGSAARSQWRVVAFSFRREEQARKKSATLARAYPALRPEVFTPTGHAPFLVTVGGAMSRDQALAFAQKSRSQGLRRRAAVRVFSKAGY